MITYSARREARQGISRRGPCAFGRTEALPGLDSQRTAACFLVGSLAPWAGRAFLGGVCDIEPLPDLRSIEAHIDPERVEAWSGWKRTVAFSLTGPITLSRPVQPLSCPRAPLVAPVDP
jgi:hypothetical protein